MKYKSLGILSALFLPMVLVSCQGAGKQITSTVVFYLEGGEVNNSSVEKITYFYELKSETDTSFIGDPIEISSVKRPKYTLESWCRTRTLASGSTEENPVYTYSDPFDFEKDKVGIDGLTLYANWAADTIFSYSVNYTDDNGDVVTLGTYSVKAGAKFNDLRSFDERREGYTPIAYYQDAALTIPWDENFTHPGGEESLDIPVYVSYVEGDYVVINTARELSRASTASSIYLNADIDLEGDTLGLAYGAYSKIFRGNGHTISNFKVGFTSSNSELYIGIFSDLREGAEVRDITFDNFTIDVSQVTSSQNGVFVGTLAGRINSGVKVDNVHVNNGQITIGSNITRPLSVNSTDFAQTIADGAEITNSEIENVTLDDKRPVSSLLQVNIIENKSRKYIFERKEK